MQKFSVRIADAHGRLVRTIRLHYHSKPVPALTNLRMPENAAKWRLAATMQVNIFCHIMVDTNMRSADNIVPHSPA